MQIDSKPGQPFRSYEVKNLLEASGDGSAHAGRVEDPHALKIRFSTDLTTATGQKLSEQPQRSTRRVIANR